jgi:hypothetical protein
VEGPSRNPLVVSFSARDRQRQRPIEPAARNEVKVFVPIPGPFKKGSVLETTSDRIERRAEIGSDLDDEEHGGYCYQRCDESVFDRGNTAIVVYEAGLSH